MLFKVLQLLCMLRLDCFHGIFGELQLILQILDGSGMGFFQAIQGSFVL